MAKQETPSQGASEKHEDHNMDNNIREMSIQGQREQLDMTTKSDKTKDMTNQPIVNKQPDETNLPAVMEKNETKINDMTMSDHPKRQIEKPKRLRRIVERNKICEREICIYWLCFGMS